MSKLPKKGSADYARIMAKFDRGIRIDDPDYQILKAILASEAWREEVENEKEDYCGEY